jgi:hypothetical protein
LSLKCKGKYSFLLKILIMLLQVRCYKQRRDEHRADTQTSGQREDAHMRSGDSSSSSRAAAAEASAVAAAAASAGRARIRPTTTIEGAYMRATREAAAASAVRARGHVYASHSGNCRAASNSISGRGGRVCLLVQDCWQVTNEGWGTRPVAGGAQMRAGGPKCGHPTHLAY